VYSIKSAAIALALLLTAQHALSEPDAALRQTELTVARIAPAPYFSVENKGGPLDFVAFAGYVATKSIEQARSREMSNLLSAAKFDVKSEFESRLFAALQDRGIKILPGDTLKTYKDDPTAFDYKSSTDASDYVLVTKIEDVGLYSSRFSRQFEPKLNVSFELTERKTEKSLYSAWIYYGADARKNSDDQILADEKFRFSSYNDTVERKEDLVESLREGVSKLSILAASQISKAFPKQ
jgi:hypothetical protein